jgi:FSR family fosmidomycin resistance protein-like MFS transporter
MVDNGCSLAEHDHNKMDNSATTATPRSDIEVISLVGFAHGTSHFFHLLLPPLFPWLMADFGLNFTQAGSLMTAFFVVSGVGQALAGFLVDRLGALRVLWAGIMCFALAATVLGLAQNHAMLYAAAMLAGLGNCVFHPADFTLLNRRVSLPRLGHAFSVHGLSGNLGWAVAPVFLTGIAATAGWRIAAFSAASLALAALALLVARREVLADLARSPAHRVTAEAAPQASTFGFLGIGAVWMSFIFFMLVTTAFGALQNFAPPVLQAVYGLSLAAAASALTFFLLGGAGGIALGGFLAGRYATHERLIAVVLAVAALLALALASGSIPAWSVGAFMAFVGFCTGIAGPSRDLLVRKAAMSRFGHGSLGRVYGFVYSGLDIGLAVSPLIFGRLMDAAMFGSVLAGVAVLQTLAVFAALRVGRVEN